MVLNLREKPYISVGPQLLCQDLQRTQCALFLNVNGDGSMSAFRVNEDAYQGMYNFCDLPEIPPGSDRDLKQARENLCKASSFDTIVKSMMYDEAVQVAMLKIKMSKVF